MVEFFASWHWNISMQDQHSFVPELLFITLWLFVWSWSNFHIVLFTVLSFQDRCAGLFEMQVDQKCPSIYSLFACFSDTVVTWPWDVIAVSNYWIWMLYSYFHQGLHRHNSWLAWYHKTMTNFMSVAYVHNLCRYQFNKGIERFRFPRWREFLTRDITSHCEMWRHAFDMKFRAFEVGL